MPTSDDSGLPDEPQDNRAIPNPYEPTQPSEVLAAPPRLAVDPVSQNVNRGIGIAIAILTLLGMVAMMGNGAPWIAALILLTPVYPAVGIFCFRTCRLSWWADLWINVGISLAVGLSVMVAAAVVCTAVVMSF